jgi:hypothetical protein
MYLEDIHNIYLSSNFEMFDVFFFEVIVTMALGSIDANHYDFSVIVMTMKRLNDHNDI